MDKKSEELLNALLQQGRITEDEYEILGGRKAITNEQFKSNLALKDKIKESLTQINVELSLDIISLVAAAIVMSYKDEETRYLRIHDILQVINTQFRCTYAENSREVIRKSALKQLINHNLVSDNGLAKTSPKFAYTATKNLLRLAENQ